MSRIDATQLAKAAQLHQAGKVEAAARIYRRLLAQAPDHPDLLSRLGIACFQLDRPSEGAALLEQALAAQPLDPGLWLNLGNCRQAEGRLDAAADCFRRALSLAPNLAGAHLNLGNVLAQAGDGAAAIGHYRRALALSPGHAKASRRLALALADEGAAAADPRLLREAVALLDRLLTVSPADGGLRQAQAEAGWRLAWMARDRAAMERAIDAMRAAGSPTAAADTELARLCLDSDQTERAAASLSATLPPGWSLAQARRPSCHWSADRPLAITEERDGLLLTGGRDWLVLRANGELRFEDMSNANPEAGQYVRAIAPNGAIALAHPAPGPALPDAVLIGGSANYYHWMLDHLPRLARLLEDGDPGLPLIVNDTLAPFQRQTLARLGVAQERLLGLAEGLALPFSRLRVPDLGTLHQTPHPWTLDWLRRTFAPASADADGPRRRILISRRDAALRRVANEDALAAALAPHGVETITIGAMTVAEQARLFAQADWIVAPHGAALTNLIFCRPGTRVVELMPNRHKQLGFFPPLSAALGLHHRRLVCRPSPSAEQSAAAHPQNFDMVADPAQVLAAVGDCI